MTREAAIWISVAALTITLLLGIALLGKISGRWSSMECSAVECLLPNHD